MDLLLLTCADSGVIDATNNRLSIFNIFDDLHTPTFPFAISRISVISLVSRTRRERKRTSAELLIKLDKKILVRGPLSFDFQNHLRARNIVEIKGLVIPGPGTLRFELRIKNKPLGECQIQVNQIKQPEIVLKPSPPLRPRAVAKPVRKKRKKR